MTHRLNKITICIEYKKNSPLFKLYGNEPVSNDSTKCLVVFQKRDERGLFNLEDGKCYKLIGELEYPKGAGVAKLKITYSKQIPEKEVQVLPIIKKYFIEEWMNLDYSTIKNVLLNLNEEGKIEKGFVWFPVRIANKSKHLFKPGYSHFKGVVVHDTEKEFALFFPKKVENNLENPEEAIQRRKAFLQGKENSESYGVIATGDKVKLNEKGKRVIRKKGLSFSLETVGKVIKTWAKGRAKKEMVEMETRANKFTLPFDCFNLIQACS